MGESCGDLVKRPALSFWNSEVCEEEEEQQQHSEDNEDVRAAKLLLTWEKKRTVKKIQSFRDSEAKVKFILIYSMQLQLCKAITTLIQSSALQPF